MDNVGNVILVAKTVIDQVTETSAQPVQLVGHYRQIRKGLRACNAMIHAAAVMGCAAKTDIAVLAVQQEVS